jgi:cytochrome oxidase assembly protein ShyY1
MFLYRQKSLSQQPSNVTPKNGAAYPWSSVDAAKFTQEWDMKPVTLKGFYDHSAQIYVTKTRNGEPGVEIVTPFYTHNDSNGVA